ncbi:helix-turn-helix domain-containing protein [Pseudonocardia sp. CA-107938]|uniref:helix-turn-helix domain-containing protein n=1 Tax=Pseudonocardia sp. CA-107938 TaxID=3240021 RepID=UPI003D9387DE
MGSPRPPDAPGAARSPRRRTLPEKIEYLFTTVRPPGGMGRTYTVREIAQRAEAAGHAISHSHIHQLRRDPSRSPTVRALEALAAGFGVSVAYFFNDETAARIEEDLELIAALRDGLVRDVALHAAGLSEASLSSIMQMIDRAREWEGLGDVPVAPPDQPS